MPETYSEPGKQPQTEADKHIQMLQESREKSLKEARAAADRAKAPKKDYTGRKFRVLHTMLSTGAGASCYLVRGEVYEPQAGHDVERLLEIGAIEEVKE